MPNRLAAESSPYLLQHANNPVDWRPWGPEALNQAVADDKPIFLSIGYSACHWCHVMAHESFENPAIAQVLNEHFINIKVDREERPDLDQLYIEAVQALTGRAGWPLSVFLTPEGEPFFGGTYWPPQSRGGMPGFEQVLQAVLGYWKNHRSDVLAQAAQLTQLLRNGHGAESSAGAGVELDQQPLVAAETALRGSFDATYGGFGSAPKFPPSMNLRVLLRRWRRHREAPLLDMVCTTLDRMADGGMYDQLGGGFHRYSVDAQWLVPHFEKMLYDNALLAATYVEAWQATGNDRYAQIAGETLDYVLREMTDPQGGFHSAEDADSPGGEGAFYVWTPAEIQSALGTVAAATFCRFYNVSHLGNFEGRNILNRPKTLAQAAAILGRDPLGMEAELAESRQKLRAARAQRPRPLRDDKVLVSWNGLMIDALARAGAALDRPQYLDAAARAADFILDKMRDADGRLLHCWCRGQAKVAAFLDDYASLGNALVSLYETQFEPRWIEAAVALAEQMCAQFADTAGGGFFYTAADCQDLLARKKEIFDSPIPSATGLATLLLVRLGKLCDRRDFRDAAEASLKAGAIWMEQAPTSVGQMLLALDMVLGPTPEIVILGPADHQPTAEALADLHGRFIPNKIIARHDGVDGQSPLLTIFHGKEATPPGPTVFVCRDHVCQPPVSGKDAAIAAWDALEKDSHA